MLLAPGPAAATALAADNSTSGILHARDFGAVGDGKADDTAAIQAALDHASPLDGNGHPKPLGPGNHGGNGVVFLDAGEYRVRQLVVPTGVTFLGAGFGLLGAQDNQSVTRIHQIEGVNDDLIVFRPHALHEHAAIGPLEISRMILKGHSRNTRGSGISFRDVEGTSRQAQDQVYLRKLVIRGFPEHGIELRAGAGPVAIEDIVLLFHGGYGIDFSAADSYASYQGVSIAKVTAAGCTRGGMRIADLRRTAGTPSGAVSIRSFFSEMRQNLEFPVRPGGDFGRRGIPVGEDAITIENCEGTPISVDGLTLTSTRAMRGETDAKGMFRWNRGRTEGAVDAGPRAAFLVRGDAGKAPKLTFRAVAVRTLEGQSAGTPPRGVTLLDLTAGRRVIPGHIHEGSYGRDSVQVFATDRDQSAQRLIVGDAATPRLTTDPRPEILASGYKPGLTLSDSSHPGSNWSLASEEGTLILRSRDARDESRNTAVLSVHGAPGRPTVTDLGTALLRTHAIATGMQTAAPDETSPAVHAANILVTSANRKPTTLRNLAGASAGQTIIVVCGDSRNATTIPDNSTFRLAAEWKPRQDDTITLTTPDGSTWFEVTRSVNSPQQ